MKTLVIGLGKSGLAAMELLQEEGDIVVGYDENAQLLTKLAEKKILVNTAPIIQEFDRIVVSPGVPPQNPFYAKAVRLGIEVIGEAELALSRLPASRQCVAITGSNGKTTVTLLTQHVLQMSGKKAQALGNVGNPLASYVKNSDPHEIMVVELSSFQLETMKTAVFNVGIILNITPNHLNRHASMEEYAGAKCHLQKLIKPSGNFWVHEAVKRDFGHLLPFPYQTYGESIEEFLKIGYTTGRKHDLENAQAAWMICRYLGVSAQEFVEALQTFKKPPHRIEFVATWNGIDFFNDSKSSNIDSTIKAVESMKNPVVLIAGGVDKGSSYKPWKKVFAGRVKKVVAIGEAAPQIAAELKPEFEVEIASSLEAAVTTAAQAAQSGECVLLSPGCSSYDMFQNYAHRGDVFKNFVLRRER